LEHPFPAAVSNLQVEDEINGSLKNGMIATTEDQFVIKFTAPSHSVFTGGDFLPIRINIQGNSGERTVPQG
jgi:hypothetical protein